MNVYQWRNECLRKVKLKESWADQIVLKAQSEGKFFRKYKCPHCGAWHVTAMREDVYNLKSKQS